MTKDIEILRDGPICMYYKNSILDEDVNWFYENRFEVYDINVKDWNRKNYQDNLKKAFDMPDYYGGNSNAFEECLNEKIYSRYQGLVIVLRRIDEFLNNDSNSSINMLDIIARESRFWLIEGKKLITLIQSNEPFLELPKLGGIEPVWNAQEWMNDSRN